ncbi:MAG TPA: protein kinase [Polyangiaceae bacterium]|nr:protein kinase [Polyangiaceae bacterium]
MAVDNPGSNPSVDLSGQDEKARARARIGKTIKGKYRLDSMLGIGGMATVYAATHRNGSRLALKILHSEFARDDAIKDRFLREGYVANKVDHPGRVAILDDDVSESGDAFLVMELLEGEELQKLWKRYNRKVPVPEALEISAQALDVLHAFHEVGIVHRDIKPANIFVTKEHVVKLLDFGVARMREAGGDKTRAGTALGTPSFMAPEQAMGLTDGVDGRADVFSIGATLYAILSGQRLHQGRSDNEAFILAATQPAPSLARIAPDLPVEVIALVDKALAWDPRNRFESAAAMRDECRQLIQKLDPSAVPVAQAPAAQAQSTQQPSAQPAAPAKKEEPVELPASESDPHVQRLIDFFRRVERLLPAVRQYGWQHPEADNKLRATHAGLVEALRESPDQVYWGLLPYSFVHRTVPVWEPAAPFDVVPYNLFAAGIRSFRVSPGVTEQEVRGLCEVLLIDPAKDLTPEDDVASALWERRLEHIKYDVINVFAEGDAADREAFYEEADQLEGVAAKASDERVNRAEAAAMNVQVDAQASQVARAAGQVLALDAMQKKAVAAQLETSPERWSERFIDVVSDAFIDTIKRRDTQLVAEPLDASARDLVLSRRFDVLFPMYDAIRRSLEQAAANQRYPGLDPRTVGGHLTRAMFGPETVRLLLVEAIRSNQQAIMQGPAAQSAVVNLDQLSQQLSMIFNDLGNDHVAAVTSVLDQTQHEGLRNVLFGFLQRTMSGREHEIADRIPNMSIDTARPLLRLLASIKTQGGFDQLRRLAQGGNPTLKCEATAYLAQTPEQLRDELTRLTEHPQPEVRQAALRTMAYHQVRAAGPLLVKRVQDPTFNQLPVLERRELFSALYVLNPQRGEQLAIEIVQKHGLLVDEPLEETRALCAELLGQNARTMEALEAVLQACKRRWWNTEPLRHAATTAAEAIAQRLGRRISPAGEVI